MQQIPLWDYSLSVYTRPGVEPLFLQLQDELGADVNMLLACCWLAQSGQVLSATMVNSALAATGGWRAECVLPLRALRRYLTYRPGQQDFREQVKKLEIEAERLQQQMLLAGWRDGAAIETSVESGEALALQNLQRYCAGLPGLEWRDVADTMIELVSLLVIDKT